MKKDEYINQPSAAPTTKVSAAGISGALTVVLVYVLGFGGVEVPPEVASALTAIVAFAASYLIKSKVSEV